MSLLILASASAIRRKMLDDAGVAHEVVPAHVDEAAVKTDGMELDALAIQLAQAKAVEISRIRPNDWVVGSDSIVTVGERRFDKPRDREQAAEHLRYFSGKSMTLTSAVALARAGVVDWSHSDRAELRVRSLSEEFIQAYLDTEWSEVRWCVGVFRMEGPGVQLFEEVEGSHFTILGMPLIPLLGALRERGIVTS